jgi:hypothetical protein
MSGRIGRWAAYAFALWLALYVGSGMAGSRGDSAEAGIWIAICATMLALPASGMSAGTAEMQSGSGRKPASPTAEGGDAQTPPPSERGSGD